MSFKRIKQYPALKAKYDQFKLWEDQTPAQRQASYASKTIEAERANHSRVEGYVSPFNTPNTERVYLLTKILSTTQNGAGSTVANTLRSLLSDYTITGAQFTALAGSPIVLPGRRYRFAKLTITSVSTTTTTQTSRITGASYKKPSVDSATSPFGQKTAAQNYSAAVTEIQGIAAFNTFLAGNNGKNRARFTPEG
ncbi:hypothetical protein IQ243_28020 [Nostocales cyanobacterium LEGE 11386]|nr:hypothetical protein [Nostocales cyanobacterium LEGE 11386]